MDRRQFAVMTLGAAAIAGAAGGAQAAKAPASWDNLVRINSKRLRYVYLLPQADFRTYSKVMLDPIEIAFEKNWQKDYNRDTRELSRKISDKDLHQIIEESQAAADKIFADAYAAGGYPVVTNAAPDVVRVRIGLMNVTVSAPDRMTAGRSYTFSDEAGQATLVVEARDSLTNALLGRAVDARVVGDHTIGQRNRVTNRGDFRSVAKRWAKQCVEGLNVLKAESPINSAGVHTG